MQTNNPVPCPMQIMNTHTDHREAINVKFRAQGVRLEACLWVYVHPFFCSLESHRTVNATHTANRSTAHLAKYVSGYLERCC